MILNSLAIWKLPAVSRLPVIWEQLMRAPASPPPARRFGNTVVIAIDDFEPLEFPWCSTPTPTSPRGRLRGITVAGNLLVLGFMLGLGTWASLAPLESAAIASGVVESESSRKTIQHLEGGIVSKILVSDGDIVRSGQTLIALDDTATDLIPLDGSPQFFKGGPQCTSIFGQSLFWRSLRH